MVEFQKDKNSKNIWYSPITLFVMLVVVLVFIYNMIDIVEKTRETAKKKKFVEEQVDKLKDREAVLENNIVKLNTQEGIEEEIREKYQLVKKGEKMVVIVDREENTEDLNVNEINKKGFINFWKNMFN